MSRYRPKCSCGRVLVVGRCPADPSCSDFRKPHQSRINAEADARAREHRSNSPMGFVSLRAATEGLDQATDGERLRRALGRFNRPRLSGRG